mmetsp:Transcript_21964/g.33217  ORF Transcript_21964/g.33217 Transcript_21964/m.33217 type:complete len:325 (-) Transcript_21964:157-1131(-)
MVGNNNPLIQLLSSLQRDEESSYLLLIQHSFSFQQRQRAASSVGSDLTVYRQAKVLTPAERAQRDACGRIWPVELASNYLKDQAIWVQTIDGMVPENCSVVSASSDPLGWDRGRHETLSSNLGNLEMLLNDIIRLTGTVRSNVIVFDSLTPLLMLHGMDRIFLFLQRLLQPPFTLIIPIFRETLTPSEHVLLEDLSNALLVLEEGNAILLRQGVRERGNVMREEVLYEINNQNHLKLLSSTNKKDETEEEKVKTSKGTTTRISQSNNVSSSSMQDRPGKIVLKIEEEGERLKKHSNKVPQIYLEDDDPEFDDLDEEDPDDDLDI